MTRAVLVSVCALVGIGCSGQPRRDSPTVRVEVARKSPGAQSRSALGRGEVATPPADRRSGAREAEALAEAPADDPREAIVRNAVSSEAQPEPSLTRVTACPADPLARAREEIRWMLNSAWIALAKGHLTRVSDCCQQALEALRWFPYELGAEQDLYYEARSLLRSAWPPPHSVPRSGVRSSFR
jgi:hypothetical protein